MNDRMHAGGCLCGAVRYEVRGPASSQCVCHCRSCRRASGAPFVAWCTFEADAFRVTAGALHEHRSSRHALRGICADCGTSLTYRHTQRPADIDVTTATLDEADAFPPTRHIWVEDKLPWVEPGDGLPRFARWSNEG